MQIALVDQETNEVLSKDIEATGRPKIIMWKDRVFVYSHKVNGVLQYYEESYFKIPDVSGDEGMDTAA